MGRRALAPRRHGKSGPGILLDTHAWIWLNLGEKLFTPSAKRMVERASSTGELYLSAISLWETVMLVSRKRLSLHRPIPEWMETAIATPGMQVVPLSPQIALETGNLPSDFHGDPADRIIAATAVHEGLTLLTHDEKLIDYSHAGLFDVLEI